MGKGEEQEFASLLLLLLGRTETVYIYKPRWGKLLANLHQLDQQIPIFKRQRTETWEQGTYSPN